ncbi:hypothetical protein PGIGA_G00121480 [Pangasianodon gigas]|uniref:Uncharacterized protein n=1 Tax=Pangasianodon gigas TaxID=30993 RepID=A0ACC5XGK5_PANGG|nr:hypothetical protein [Pangasianodon gigas]
MTCWVDLNPIHSLQLGTDTEYESERAETGELTQSGMCASGSNESTRPPTRHWRQQIQRSCIASPAFRLTNRLQQQLCVICKLGRG